MDTMFENFHVWYDDGLGCEKPLVFACRDREAISEERWVLASLSNTEAKKLYEYLQKTLKVNGEGSKET